VTCTAFLALLAVTSFGMLATQVPLEVLNGQGVTEQQVDDYKPHVRVR